MLAFAMYQKTAFWIAVFFLIPGIAGYIWGCWHSRNREPWDGTKGIESLPGALLIAISIVLFMTAVHWALGVLLLAGFVFVIYAAACTNWLG